nr:MAG TPA: hypothetical protein [Caudoviricetes sp.]
MYITPFFIRFFRISKYYYCFPVLSIYYYSISVCLFLVFEFNY